MEETKATVDHIHLPITGVKLAGISNYTLWVQAVQTYLYAKDKVQHLTEDPPSYDPKDKTSTAAYTTWMRDNSTVKIWLWNSMEPAIVSNVMYHSTAKGVWTDLRGTYSQAKNVSRIYEIYEKLFTHKQGDRSLSEFFGSFKGLIECPHASLR
ncbi:uncharacterized protein LOC122651218 [Telopea speciosissima]|uniref:uncharacterized protein LOC122651218 n=1 Tax=Telopea speciosissima TaxID=54955 RepID=UPI001CC7D383|nr:uncharacterized protein LOC122651218 [Telopea speciosissima]